MLDTLIHRWLRVPYQLHVHAHRTSKRHRRTVVLLHGLGNSGAAWDEVIEKLEPNIRVISLDLLGFGNSPRPTWAVYNVRTQARSVIATLLSLRLSGRVILVGHSLGGLVSIEVAKRYPLIIRSLILCSPPLYDQSSDSNLLIKSAFRRAKRHPERFLRLAAIAMKYNLVNKSFRVSDENIEPYMATLGASILNQTSLDDVKKLNKPITILFGTVDPWVKKRNLKSVIKANPRAELRVFLASHEIRGPYVQQVVKAIADAARVPSKLRAIVSKNERYQLKP